jgi:hypothetical protein
MKCNVKRTADILTIFKKVSDYIHLDKGKCEGHFCLVCRFVLFFNFSTVCNRFPRDKGIRQAEYFFSGGTSTLQTHIARYSALYSIYCDILSDCFKGMRTISTSTNSDARILIYLSTVRLSLLHSDPTPTFSHTAPSVYTPTYETPDTWDCITMVSDFPDIVPAHPLDILPHVAPEPITLCSLMRSWLYTTHRFTEFRP